MRDADLVESVDWVESWSRILKNDAASSENLHGFVIWSCVADCTLLKRFAHLVFFQLRSWFKIFGAFTIIDIFDWLSLIPIKILKDVLNLLHTLHVILTILLNFLSLT